jgi:antitoxin PrlF
MKPKTYTISPAKIGNQQGFRLPRAFYQDNPHLAETGGEIEVLNEDTLLIRLHPNHETDDHEDEGLMMSLFLDFLTKDAMKNPEQLIPYTEEMSQEIDDLLTDVKLEEE